MEGRAEYGGVLLKSDELGNGCKGMGGEMFGGGISVS